MHTLKPATVARPSFSGRSLLHRAIAGLFIAGLTLAPVAATAQDINADPTYGEFHLEPGFTPDPALLSVMAGGDVNATTKFKGCEGFVSNAPDVRLFWDSESSSGLKIKISAMSNADTTLVVNGPDGQWYCDDDSGEDANPSVELTPAVGRYEIWIGTYSQGEIKKAVLGISEISSF